MAKVPTRNRTAGSPIADLHDGAGATPCTTYVHNALHLCTRARGAPATRNFHDCRSPMVVFEHAQAMGGDHAICSLQRASQRVVNVVGGISGTRRADIPGPAHSGQGGRGDHVPSRQADRRQAGRGPILGRAAEVGSCIPVSAGRVRASHERCGLVADLYGRVSPTQVPRSWRWVSINASI